MKKNLKTLVLATALLISAHPLIGCQEGAKSHKIASPRKQMAKALLREISVKSDANLLIVGLDSGHVSPKLAKVVPEGSITTIGRNELFIEKLKGQYPTEEFPNLFFKVEDPSDIQSREKFDTVISLSPRSWFHNPHGFIRGAYQALKAQGTLAFTISDGLPSSLQQALDQTQNLRRWAHFFDHEKRCWILPALPAKDEWASVLEGELFTGVKVTAKEKMKTFASREKFEVYLKGWLPQVRALPCDKIKEKFVRAVVNTYLELEGLNDESPVTITHTWLEVIGSKN